MNFKDELHTRTHKHACPRIYIFSFYLSPSLSLTQGGRDCNLVWYPLEASLFLVWATCIWQDFVNFQFAKSLPVPVLPLKLRGYDTCWLLILNWILIDLDQTHQQRLRSWIEYVDIKTSQPNWLVYIYIYIYIYIYFIIKELYSKLNSGGYYGIHCWWV